MIGVYHKVTPDSTIAFVAGLGDAFEAVLGDRFGSLVVYGSAVTGDANERFSDLDIALFLHGQTGVRDMIAVQERVARLEPAPLAYVQLSHVIDLEREPPRPIFTPGTWEVARGASPGRSWEHSEETLKAAAFRTLEDLPELLRKHAQDWAVATGADRGRRIRILSTLLKPAVRSLLSVQGDAAVASFAATYDEIADRWERTNRPAAECLRTVLDRLPASPQEENEVGSALLSLASMVMVDASRCLAGAATGRA